MVSTALTALQTGEKYVERKEGSGRGGGITAQDEAEAPLLLLSSRKASTPSAKLAALGLPADQVLDESLE